MVRCMSRRLVSPGTTKPRPPESSALRRQRRSG
ncbi:UNVERIFIED_CONTAM: hypothetical protein GTU68_035527 [Idotea baltica]|nr:hypothetical protein [Idotea baltica]